MRKTTVVCGVLALGVVAATLAYRARRAEQAQQLVVRAERLVHPPLSDATSWQEVRASEAVELLEEARELSPSPELDDLLVQAEVIQLLQRGSVAAATERLAALPAGHDDADHVVLRASVALAAKDSAAAERMLSKLSGRAAEQPRVWLLRSDLARARGQADGALASAEHGLTLAPKSAALHERRGLAYELLGDLPRARADLEQAASLEAHGTSALLALGRVLRDSGAFREAVLAFHSASQRNPADAETWLGSGVSRAALGDFVSARVDLERAAELAPRRTEPLLALADVDVEQGELATALGRYRAAALLDPNSAVARVKLGNALLRSRNVDAAVTEFRAAIERRPDVGAAHNGLGVALLERGELNQAENEFKLAAELDPHDAHPMLNLARVYKRRGDSPQLANALAQAEARDPHLRVTSDSANAKHEASLTTRDHSR